MVRHAPTTTVAERVTILERATAGATDSMIAAALGCSIWTVRKWRRRGQHRGRLGLTPALGQLSQAPLSTIPPPKPMGDMHPHDEWERDAQGWMLVDGIGNVYLVNILDVVSRFKVERYPCLNTTSSALETYQLALRRAFLATGLPKQISFDHGTVFVDTTTTSPNMRAMVARCGVWHH